MNKNLETTFRLGTATAVLMTAVACSPRRSSVDVDKSPTSVATATYEPIIPSATPLPDIFTPLVITPEISPSVSEPRPYELPGGVRLDDSSHPVFMTIKLPDGNEISSVFKFITDPSGAKISTLSAPGDGTVTTYYAPGENRNFIIPHSGKSPIDNHSLEAEALRFYIEGQTYHTNSPEQVNQKLASLVGATYSLIIDGHTFTGIISFAIRIPPRDVTDFTYNFVIGPEFAAQKHPDLAAQILAPDTLYYQTCGTFLTDASGKLIESNPDRFKYYDASRLLLGIIPSD